MASNRNSPNKGQGANEPNNQQSLETDAANVDWMIISDLSTRIGVTSKTKETHSTTNAPTPPSETPEKNQQLNDDLEDLEWLKSIGLDEPIERSPSSKITTNNQPKNEDVGNIDWLIVTDLKTRIDDPDIKSTVSTPPLAEDLADELDNDLGIDDLDFLGDTNFPELESLDFGNSDSAIDNELSVTDLLNEIDITEGKISELSQLVDNQPINDLFDLNNESLDNDWEQIANISDSFSKEFNESDFQQNSQTNEDESLDLVSDSFVRPTKLAKIGTNELEDPLNSLEEFIESSNSEIIYSDFDEFQNQSSSYELADELADQLVEDLALDQEIVGDFAEDELLHSFIPENEEIVNATQLADQELDESLSSEQVDEWLEKDVTADNSNELEEINTTFAQVQSSEQVDHFADDAFGQFQASATMPPLTHDDEIWAIPSIENDASNSEASLEDAFTSDWETANSVGNIGSSNEALWDDPFSHDSEDLSHTAIENAFAASEEYIDASGYDVQDWSMGNEPTDESNNVPTTEWVPEANALEEDFGQYDESINQESEAYIPPSDEFINQDSIAEIYSPSSDAFDSQESEEEYFPPSDAFNSQESEEYFQPLDELVNSEAIGGFADTYSEDSFDFSASIDEESFNSFDHSSDHGAMDIAIADASIDAENDVELDLDQNLIESIADFSEQIEAIENIDEYPEANNLLANSVENSDDFAEYYEAENPLISEDVHDSYANDYANNLENNLDNSLDVESDWEAFNESIDEQITPPDLSTNFGSFDNQVQAVQEIEAESGVASDWDNKTNDSLTDYDDLGSLESFIDDNFDLDAFDEESFPEVPISDLSQPSIPTTLTPNRNNSTIEDDYNSPKDITDTGTAGEYIDSIDSIDIAIEDSLASDPFEEALAIDLLNGEPYPQQVDLIEEAIANDLLNGDMPEASNFKSYQRGIELPPPPVSSSSLMTPSKFGVGETDHDFLDNFDLDNLDNPLDGDNFDSNFVPPSISTGLNVQSTPPIPPAVAPMDKQDNITSPSLINPPPPPPFLPPLPPKRSPHQNQNKTLPHPPTSPNLSNHSPVSRLGQDEFESFHGQSLGSRSEPAIDEGWTDLLDADTVLSGVLRPPTTPYTDMGGSLPPSSGNSRGRSASNLSGGSSLEKERRQPTMPKRRDTGLPDLNDLGLEIHDDNTDWSGLLDTSDISDNITSISNTSTQLPPRNRQLPLRSDLTGVSETRELPRDRRPMSSFGDATQARMAAPPDQIDFNRFTEDNYGSYSSYEPPVEKAPAPSPSRTKITIPSISIESLWQDYLKLPVIGLGVIGGAFLLYSLANRPVFDLGLRWGLFKDASGKDFTNYDFKGAKLDNVDFSKAILTGAKMQDASLVGANFQEANLDGVNFTNANLSRARLIQSSVIWSEFKNAQMNLVDFAGADLTRSNFSGAKMEGANFKGTKIGAQGTEKATRLSPTTLLAWQIVNEPREGRNLANQDLSGLNLSFTSLKRANLTNVKLNYTDLTGTDLSGANLSGGQINGANLSGAKLNGINLTDVNLDKSKLPKTDEETVCPNGQKGPCKF